MKDVIEKALSKSKSDKSYREARQRLDDIGRQLSEARNELVATIREQHNSSVSKANPIEAEALELLGYPAPAREENQRKSLEDLQRRIKVLEAALPIQEKAVRELQRKRANELGPLLRKIHEPIVLRAATVLQEAAEAFAEQRALLEAIASFDLSTGSYMRPMDNLGLKLSPHSKLVAWLGEARGHGYNV